MVRSYHTETLFSTPLRVIRENKLSAWRTINKTEEKEKKNFHSACIWCCLHPTWHSSKQTPPAYQSPLSPTHKIPWWCWQGLNAVVDGSSPGCLCWLLYPEKLLVDVVSVTTPILWAHFVHEPERAKLLALLFSFILLMSIKTTV